MRTTLALLKIKSLRDISFFEGSRQHPGAAIRQREYWIGGDEGYRPLSPDFAKIRTVLTASPGGHREFRSLNTIMIECPHCDKLLQTYQSWHRHKTLSHPEHIRNAREVYNADPLRCRECDSIIPYERRSNYRSSTSRLVFCSKKCSGLANNRSRDKNAIAETVRATWRRKNGHIHHDQIPKIKSIGVVSTLGQTVSA